MLFPMLLILWMNPLAFSLSPPIETYKEALLDLGQKKSCQKLQTLSSHESFSLRELALIRHGQYCKGSSSWEKMAKQVKDPILQSFVYRYQFEMEIKKKNFVKAYRVYSKHGKEMRLNRKDFEKMAPYALKGNLSSKEKRALSQELYKKAPRFIPRPKKEDYMRVARDFRKNREFKKALFYYRAVLNDLGRPYKERWKGFQGARTTYKLERWSQMKKYLLASKQWARFLRKTGRYKKSAAMTKMHHDANIEYIRSLWTEKGQTQAKPVLDRLERELKGRYSMEMIYWLKGKMAEERKNYKQTVWWLKKASDEKLITRRGRDRVLWSLAWNQRRIKAFRASQESIEKLKKSPELTFFSKTKYIYWQAENLKSMDQKKKAQKAFKKLADLDQYGYYGALARRELKEPFPVPPRPEFKDKDLLNFLGEKDQSFLKDLVEVKEFEISEALILKRLKYKKSWSLEKGANYLKLLQYGGAYKAFFTQYHRLSPQKQLGILDQYPNLLFPQPYGGQVRQASKTTQISPALIYSIMKQESGFDTRARSPAHAFGLLQLLPSVAEKIAQKMPSISYDSPEDLFQPEVSIPLGAKNLQSLFSRFKRNFILSVASYNASERAVRGWVKRRYHADPVTFIEDIPYDETKGYIKLVMRNYITYNRFATHQEPFYFPEVCLQGLEKFK